MSEIIWTGITSNTVIINGLTVNHKAEGGGLLEELYRERINNYPKFFKMDTLCKLGFVASEFLLQYEEKNSNQRFVPCEDRAVILFNRSSSMNADKRFQATIQNPDNYFPSPSVFVYTLPNIVTGEIAIRNKYFGETSFYVLEEFSPNTIAYHIDNAFRDGTTKSVIGGWLNCDDEDNFEALLFIADNTKQKISLSEKIELFSKQLNIKENG